MLKGEFANNRITVSGGLGMQLVGVVLLLISVGTVVGPIGAVAYTYRDNLVQLVVPPQIDDLIGGNSSMLPQSTNQGSGAFLQPVFVGSMVDTASRSFSVTVNFTNTLGYDLTINGITAQVVCAAHDYQLGTISLAAPVIVLADQTSQIVATGSWTQEAENHVQNQHPGSTSIDVNLVSLTINVNGITIQQNEPISVGAIPIA
jgi:hypothetical protein